jgi:hypothetical protein
MSYGVRQIALPSKEPVSLAEAKTFCRVPVSITDEDALISALITSARIHAETVTNRCLAQRQFVLTLDRRPQDFGRLPWVGSISGTSLPFNDLRNGITIPNPPLKSVDSVRYIALDGSAVTLNPDVDYVVDRISEPGRIFPPFGSTWPAALHVANAIEATFTAGYDPDPAATADTHNVSAPTNQQPDSTVVLAVPQTIRVAILMLVNHWYVNREPVAAGAVGTVPSHVDALLAGVTITDFYPVSSNTHHR